jgi:hypothetical protein
MWNARYEEAMQQARQQDHMARLRKRTVDDPEGFNKANLLPADEAAMEWALREIEDLRACLQFLESNLPLFVFRSRRVWPEYGVTLREAISALHKEKR